MKFFRKKNPLAPAPIADPTAVHPVTAADYLKRGYAYHSRNHHAEAEADFRQALAQEPGSVEAVFALGLVLKAQGQHDEAVEKFKETLQHIEAGDLNDPIRSTMMRRLTKGHINQLIKGDWDLAREIWKERQ